MDENDLISDVGNDDVISATTQKEIAAFNNFELMYRRIFPYPEAAQVRMKEILGWKFWAAITQNIFAITLAAMRTADMFYRIAVSSSAVLAVVEAIAAVGAVEGGIVIFAAIRAESQNRIADGEVRVHAPVWQLWLGEALGILISVVAGLGLSFRGLGLDAANFNWWLSIIIGAGASFIAAISGEIIGSTLSGLSNAKAIADAKFKQEVTAWSDGLYKKWKSSDELRISRGDIRAASHATRSAVRSVRTNGGRVNGRIVGNEIHDKIFGFLDNYITVNPEASTIPGPTELSGTLGVSKSYASTTSQQWLSERGYAVPVEVTS